MGSHGATTGWGGRASVDGGVAVNLMELALLGVLSFALGILISHLIEGGVDNGTDE